MLLGGAAEYSPHAKESRMLEIRRPEELEALESPRILNTHYPYELLPENMGASKCKIIYMLRNPKDVAVSLYHHLTKHDDFRYNGSWSNFLQLYLGDKCKSVLYTILFFIYGVPLGHSHYGSISTASQLSPYRLQMSAHTHASKKQRRDEAILRLDTII